MKYILILSLALLGLSLTYCSSDSSSSGVAAISNSDTFPVDLAIASITAESTVSASANSSFAVDSSKDIKDKKESLGSLANGASASACQIVLPNIAAPNNPSCYGPQVFYANHPDHAGTDANYDPDGGGMPNNDEDGILPTGDLGLWSSTEGSSGEACAAAKLNQLITSVAQRVDTALYSLGSVRCLMNVNGTAKPDAGDTVDLTSTVNTALSTANSNLSVTAASFSRAASDIAGNPIYQYTLTMSLPNNDSATINMKHSPSTTGDYYGRIWSSFTQSGSGNVFAFSVAYSKTSSNLNYQMLNAGYNPSPTNVFNSDGSLMIDGDWSGNISNTTMGYNTSTSNGVATYAWQAGTGDSNARVFNLFVSPSGTTEAGCAFFGYGPRFDNSSSSTPASTIDRFICNWAGPGNNHTGVANFAQKQCFSRTTGTFTPTTESITYAPVNSCDKAATEHGSFAGTTDYFRYATTDPGGGNYATGSNWDVYENIPVAGITNDLVDLTSDTDYTGFTAPTAPTLPTGF